VLWLQGKIHCLTFLKGDEWSVIVYDDFLLSVSVPRYDLHGQIAVHFYTVARFNRIHLISVFWFVC
jgi:hypothetical protein